MLPTSTFDLRIDTRERRRRSLLCLALFALLQVALGAHCAVHAVETALAPTERFASATHASDPAHVESAQSEIVPGCLACLLVKTSQQAIIQTAAPAPPALRSACPPVAPPSQRTAGQPASPRAPPLQ